MIGRKESHWPIDGMENPSTPLEKSGEASNLNVQGIKENGDKKVLPEIKIREVETKN